MTQYQSGFGPRVVRKIERADAQTAAALGELGVATVHEAYRRRGLLHGITAAVPGTRFAGPAVTCLNYPGDNLMLHAAIEVCRPGDVLVVAVTAPSLHGMLGELVATCCRARGIVGVVLDSAVRDVDELRAMQYPVFSRGITAQGTTKAGLGWVNTPVSCAGAVVFPGDVVIGDSDGVVVVEREAAQETLEAARKRADRERDVRKKYEEGALTLDMGTMRDTLAKGRVEYVDD
ncbi:MAG TPA: 4-carboxy-4-hydroxy-2-oxoadipate aldolase/oxaloacetate decarboxylase [Actinocrinis sp.]|jgi:4-hydroxy-4-methyl-2-oxoglutarate aldolase